MSETISFPPVSETSSSTRRTPIVYFIDDSATMREVIKIAFRKENITVITAGDAASAIAQFEQNPPDAVITDVIMPDQDGYSVCSQIKQHERFGRTPVILMSGVVNKSVADKAVSVGADELIRKPFQPLDLIARVKSFLDPKSTPAAPQPVSIPRTPQPSPLSSLFAPPVPAAPNAFPGNAGFPSGGFAQPPAALPAVPAVPISVTEARPNSSWPGALADAFLPSPHSPHVPPANAAHINQPSQPPFAQPQRPQPTVADLQRLKVEISRLELLVKKLQTELQIERQYNQALELHVKSLTSIE